jgi:hypothetical protein
MLTVLLCLNNGGVHSVPGRDLELAGWKTGSKESVSLNMAECQLLFYVYYIYLYGAGPQEPEQVCYNKTVYVREIHYDIAYSQECVTQYKEECNTDYKTSCKHGYETVRYRYP